MTKLITCIFCIISGFIGGATICAIYMQTHYNLSSRREDLDEMVVPIPHIMQWSKQVLPTEYFHCDNENPDIANHTVGNIMSDILINSATNKETSLSYKCDFEQHQCSISSSDCHGWQPFECGSRSLTFHIDDKLKIIPDSFECVDIP